MIKVGSLWLAIFIQPSCQSFCSGDASGDKTVEFKTQNSELGTWAMVFLFIWPVIAQLAVPVTVKLYATGMYMGTREIRETSHQSDFTHWYFLVVWKYYYASIRIQFLLFKTTNKVMS